MNAKRILLPLDGSQVAEAALPLAVDLASAAGGALFLLRVIEAPAPGSEPGTVRLDAAREAEGYLGDVARRARASGAGKVTVALWQGTPAHAIVAAAEQHGADMIVMATHGRTGLQRECFGSVAESVLRGTARPVLVVHAGSGTCEAPGGRASPLTVAVGSA